MNIPSLLVVECLALVALFTFQGCTNPADPGPMGIVFRGGNSYHIDQGQTITLNLAISNDPNGYGVTRTCASTTNSCPNPPFKSTNPFQAFFTASAGTGTATITATSTNQKGDSATATITIAPGLSITASSLPSATVGIVYNQTLTSTGGIAPLTWSISTGALPPGLSINSSTGAIAGTPTGPASATPVSFTAAVTDSSASPLVATKPLSITVNSSTGPLQCGTGSESLLNGQYAMLVNGLDKGTGPGETSPEPAFVGGVLFPDGQGNIALGSLYVNAEATPPAGVQQYSVTGTYQVGSDHRGCMTLATSAGTQHYAFSLGGISGSPAVASSGHVIDFDTNGPFTAGVLLKQDTSAFSSLSGTFAFGLDSPQNTVATAGGKEAAAGVLTLAGGNVTGGTFDVNIAGMLEGSSAATWTAATPLAIGAGGTYVVNSFTGAGNILFPVTIGGNAITVQMIFFVVSSNQMLLMSITDQTDPNGLFLAGQALKQTSGSFSGSSLNGVSVLSTSALQGSTVTSLIATLTTTSAGSINLFGWQTNGTAIQNQTSTNASGTLQVASNGRVTYASGTGNLPVLWLVGNNEGFYLGSGSDVQSGFFQPQTATTISTGTPYALGTIDPLVASADLNSGVAAFTGTSISGVSDDNSAGTLNQSQVLGPVTYSVSGTGLGSAPSGCTIGGTGATGCQYIFYVISPTMGVQLNLLNGQGNVKSNTGVQTAAQ